MVTRREVLATGAAIAAGTALLKGTKLMAARPVPGTGSKVDPTSALLATLQMIDGVDLTTTFQSLNQIIIPDAESPPVYDTDYDDMMDFPDLCELAIGSDGTTWEINLDQDQYTSLPYGQRTFKWDSSNNPNAKPLGYYQQQGGESGTVLITSARTPQMMVEGAKLTVKPPDALSLTVDYFQKRQWETDVNKLPAVKPPITLVTGTLKKISASGQPLVYEMQKADSLGFINFAICRFVPPVWALTLTIAKDIPGATPQQGAIPGGNPFPKIAAGTVLTLQRTRRSSELHPVGHYLGASTGSGVSHAMLTAK